MKKIVALVLSVFLCIGLFSFPAYAEEIRDSYMVGVIIDDPESRQAEDIMGCLRNIGEPLGVTFVTGYGGPDQEQEIQAVQNFGVGGYDGILNLCPGTIMQRLLQICEEYGMFMVTSGYMTHNCEGYEEFSQNPYFAGECWEDEQVIVDTIIKYMIANSAKDFGLLGFPSGVSEKNDQRIDFAREKLLDLGISDDRIHEAQADSISDAAEELLAQYPDLDAVFSSAETVSSVCPLLADSEKSGEVQLNCYEAGDDAVAAFRDGTLSYAVTGNCADSMIAFILLYNAMNGNKMMQDDGSAPSINMKYLFCTSAEEMENAAAYCSESNPPYTPEELQTFIEPGASYNSLKEFAEKFSLDDVMERHSAS